MKNYIYLSLIVLLVSACGSTIQEKAPTKIELTQLDSYALSIECGDNVPFSGYVDLDEFKKRHAVSGAYYSGYDAVSFLATVLAHAATSKSMDRARMKKFIDESNEKALGQCAPILASFYTKELIEHIDTSSETSDTILYTTNWAENDIPLGYIKSTPSFILTKEHDSIIVENSFIVTKHEEELKTTKNKNRKAQKKKHDPNMLYKNKIIVIMENRKDDPGEVLIADNGAYLKELTKNLFSESFTLFQKDFTKESLELNNRMETIRFQIGSNFRVERGKVLERTCDRVIFQTLRGHIKSVPQNLQECSDTEKQLL